MGRPESCIHAKPPGFHGEELAGKRGNGKTGIPMRIGEEFEELKIDREESEALSIKEGLNG